MKTYQIWVSGFQVPTRMPAMGSMSYTSLQQLAQPLWTALVPCLPFRGCSGSPKWNKLRNAPNNRFLNLTHKKLPFSFIFLPQSILVSELGSRNIMNWFYFIRNTSLYIHLFLSPLNHVAYFGYFGFELKCKMLSLLQVSFSNNRRNSEGFLITAENIQVTFFAASKRNRERGHYVWGYDCGFEVPQALQLHVTLEAIYFQEELLLVFY